MRPTLITALVLCVVFCGCGLQAPLTPADLSVQQRECVAASSAQAWSEFAQCEAHEPPQRTGACSTEQIIEREIARHERCVQ